MDDVETAGEVFGSVVAAAVVFLVPTWRIYKRAGFAPALSLLVLIPFASVILASLILAVRRWPATEHRSGVGSER